MPGSNDYIFKLGASGSELVIAGSLDGTMTNPGAPVEITNKANGGKVEYFDGFVAGQQIVWAGTFTLLAETVQNTIKAAIESGTQIPGVLETAVGGVPQMSVTFSTSGAYTYTAPS